MTTLFRVLLDSSIRISVVALLVGVLLALWRVRSGGLRHAAWVAVLCAMPLMPVLPNLVPAVAVPIPVGAGVSAEAPFSIEPPAAVPAAAVPTATRDIGLPAARANTAPPHREPLWPAFFVLVYAVGVLTLLGRLLKGWAAVQRILGSATEVSAQGLSAYESDLVSAPVTVGVLEPRVLLPSDWREWPHDKLRAVLAHELAHVARRDTLTSLLAQLNRCIFWFHPLSWWLERQLSTAAEHACDDAGVRAIGESRKYAEVLVEIADSVRRRGGRLAVQGVGVDGAGSLDRRIDRVLRGGPFAAPSGKRKVLLAVCCVATILVVAACRRQSIYAGELKPDPAYAQQAAERQAAGELAKSVSELTSNQVAELEAAAKGNPQDLETRRKLMAFYQTSGRKVLGEEATRVAFRSHKLWWIQNHPEDPVASMVGPLMDLALYEQSKKLWLAVLEQKDASAAALTQAAAFVQVFDRPLAEKTLLRAQALDPNTNRSRQFAAIYGAALTGAPGAFAEHVRGELATSSDPALLSQTAVILARTPRRPGVAADSDALSQEYLDRALKLDPNSRVAQSGLVVLRAARQQNSLPPNLGNEPSEIQYHLASALPEAERFHVLPSLAERAYVRGDSLDYYDHNPAAAKVAWELARRYAQDALVLAPRYTSDATYGMAIYKANMNLGAVAMRVDGDTRAAARYLVAASKTPSTDNSLSAHTLKLPVALLKYGGHAGREAVVEYLERYGKLLQRPDVDLLHAAQQIRQGYMPIWYQAQAAKLK